MKKPDYIQSRERLAIVAFAGVLSNNICKPPDLARTLTNWTELLALCALY